MKKVLGLDFETQGSDHTQTNPTEIGAVLVEVTPVGELDQTIESWKITKQLSQLLWQPGYPPQTPEIVELTGITDDMLRAEGKPPKEVFESKLFPLIEEADIIVAHNKAFDQGVLIATSQREQLTPPNKRWLCTWSEVPYPPKHTCKKLSHLALDHGIKMDDRELHRAVNDVRLMLELLSKYSLDRVIAYADEPNTILRAVIPAPWTDNGVGKEQATRLGYSWESPRGTTGLRFAKCWVKQVKVSQIAVETERAPFQVVEIKGEPKCT